MSATPVVAAEASSDWLTPRRAAWVFLAFAQAYFVSTLIRAVTATLSPSLSAELALTASDLGLLAGGYFFGFAMTQLPLGRWLDRHGPRRVILAFLGLAVIGCAAFALATSFAGLLAARVLTGMGVSACLMAPLTGFRRWLSPATLLRVNSWMLMTGSLGMVAATLPVQWLLPVTGWRGLFWLLSALVLLAMLVLALVVPRWGPAAVVAGPHTATHQLGYAQIARHPFFRQMVPIGFVNYGGMVAMQTLWAGPWMVQVAGYSGERAAFGLFAINLCMLVTFSLWGWVTPHLARRRLPAERLIAYGLPVSLCVLAMLVLLGPRAGWPVWALFCISSSFVSLAQPAVAQALPAQSAGRALSAYNLVLFAGIFTVQWGVGLVVDAFGALGWSTEASFQGAVAVFGLCCLWAYSVFLRGYRRHATLPQG
jgi:predicted MFS family arabinose efflux permease